MALDPRRFLQDHCPPATLPQRSDRERKFFQNLGKVGDLEVLNEANSKIGQGLRTLGDISENVRNNSGPVPSIIRQTGAAVLDTGADFVLNTLQLDARQTREQGIAFSPQVANRALAQAESVYDAVRNGQLDEFEDLPTAIAEFSNLEILLRSIFTNRPARLSKFKDLCVSSYARDLIDLAPKHKFMFIVEFVFNDPYSGSVGAQVSNKELNFAFVIKRSTRPQIMFDYEDVNLYNFRTRVLKRMEYQPMSMVFYDDIQNRTLLFYENYLKAVSPISRIDPTESDPNSFDERGMDFINFTGDDGAPNIFQGGFSASISTLNPGTTTSPNNTPLTPKTVINHVNLYHLVNAGRAVDVYSFGAPKITELQLDDLDMTDSGEGNEVSMAFVYDNMFLRANVPIEQVMVSDNLTDLTNIGQFPIEPNLSASISAENVEP